MRQLTILVLFGLAAGQRSRCAQILHLDAGTQAALSPPASAELGLIGVNVHRFRGNAALDAARDAGFRFVRADLLWERVERGGGYRFNAYDGLMNALGARGLGALLILDYGHPDHGGKVPRSAEDIAAFGRFAEAAAKHFQGRKVRYEIWNEPDIATFWPPKPDPQVFAAVLRAAVTAIHRADPGAEIVSGGVSRFDLKYLRKAIDPKVASGLRAIGLHPYPREKPEKIEPDLQKLRDWARRAFGERMQVWDTEWGYSSTGSTRLQQAQLAVREILTVWSAGFPLGVWYDLQDDGPDLQNPEQNYGLLDVNGTPKPAMLAMRTLLAAAKGRRYAGGIPRTPSGVHAMRFDGDSDVLFIVWSERDKRQTLQYAADNLTRVTGMMGEALQLQSDRSGVATLEIREESGPVYLIWKRR